ncbi:hypothetical protein ACWEL8_09685 [Streptomyces sp. NPDC004690]
MSGGEPHVEVLEHHRHQGARQPSPHDLPETPVTPRTPPPISHHLKPRLATALFRRYLRACIPLSPDRTVPRSARAEAQQDGQGQH